jgi:biotin transporter BioY
VLLPNVFQDVALSQKVGQSPWFCYMAQLPWALMMGALLGPWLGTTMMVCIVGLSLLGVPLMANGGGTQALIEASAPYWPAMVLGSWWCARQTQKRLLTTCNGFNWLWQATTLAFASVTLTHAIGFLGLLSMAAMGMFPGGLSEAWHWFWTLSVSPYGYDLTLVWLGMLSLRIIRAILWLVVY